MSTSDEPLKRCLMALRLELDESIIDDVEILVTQAIEDAYQRGLSESRLQGANVEVAQRDKLRGGGDA